MEGSASFWEAGPGSEGKRFGWKSILARSVQEEALHSGEALPAEKAVLNEALRSGRHKFREALRLVGNLHRPEGGALCPWLAWKKESDSRRRG